MKSVNTHQGFSVIEYSRCPDCDIRGDLDVMGKRRHTRFARIKRCSECEGKAELRRNRRDDPMGRSVTDPKALHYAHKRAGAAWTQRNRFRNDPPTWIVRLQEEPPKGENHGRKRTSENEPANAWITLETSSPPSVKTYLEPRMREAQRKHGTSWAYNDGCRCDRCKTRKSELNRIYRKKATPLGEQKSSLLGGPPSEKPDGSTAPISEEIPTNAEEQRRAA